MESDKDLQISSIQLEPNENEEKTKEDNENEEKTKEDNENEEHESIEIDKYSNIKENAVFKMADNIIEEVQDEGIEVTEEQTLQDMIFMLQGIPPLHLLKNNKFPPLTQEVVPLLSEVSKLLIKLNNKRVFFNPQSFVQRSVCCTANDIISEYYQYIAHIDSELHHSEMITILDMYRHGLWCKDIIITLTDIIDQCMLVKGGQLLTYLDEQTHSPYQTRKKICIRMLQNGTIPIYNMIYDWVLQGTFNDPFHDFFLTLKSTPSLLETTYLQNQLVPSFLNSYKNDIKFVGEATTFLQKEGEDISDLISIIESNKNEFTISSSTLPSLIHSLNTLAHQKAVKLLTEKYTPLIHTQNIKQYILLFRGDFANTFIDSLSQALVNGPLSQVDLNSYFHAALAVTNTIPERLHCICKGQEVNQIETDILLHYELPEPLQLIITDNHIQKYNEIFKFLWKIKCMSISIDKAYRNMFPFFILASQINGLPLFLHHFRIKFGECAKFMDALEEYAYVHMKECYVHFEDAWKSAVDLYGLSSIHGAYVEEICKVLYISNDKVNTILNSIIGFISNAVEKLNAFIAIISDEIYRQQFNKQHISQFLSTLKEMEDRVNLELDNYKAYYNQFIMAIASADNKQTRFLLRRLNPERYNPPEISEIVAMDEMV
ncbi:hypothetical protein ENUP19_0370G0025 [Entamoeba nuttalli]|uniref:Spindle pole body component n=1 Tax=Entamoeba nuttalli TaxID=412467 RepID=A0ABQ0DYW1_9EUKA